MEWQRIKGSIRALEQTFWDDEEQFKAYRKEAERFIEAVEDNGLQE